MGNKVVTITIVVVLATVAFGVSFMMSRWFGAKPAPAAAAQHAGAEGGLAGDPAAAQPVAEIPRVEERHLYDLIKEVRQKVRDCQKREQELSEQEKRIQMTRQLLEKETQDLENLRLQLATSVAKTKEAQAELERTRIAIDRSEQVNLKRTSAIYDKMDTAAAAQIITGMCTNKQEDDAVKILYYMTERQVAKVLGEMTDKGQAARLSEQMKRVKDQSAVAAEGPAPKAPVAGK